MGIQINGATDSITAIDGTIDVVSAIGNAGVVTATAFVGNITGNVTGNINHTSNLELQTGGVTRAHFNSSGHFNVAGISTFTGRSDHNSPLQMLAGNNIILLNDANSANCQIDCYGGAGFRLTSYNQTMFTCENGSTTKFYTNNGNSRLEIDNSGDVQVVTGTLHIPDALQHYGDTDTKIRFPAADTVTVETAGSERLRITSDGRIGINDPSPNDYEVDILKRSTATDAQIRLYNNATGSSNDTVMRYQIGGTTANNYIYFGDGDDTNAGQIRYNHNNNFLAIHTNAAERLRIASDGKVGINQAAPRTTLDVNGYVFLGNGQQIQITGSSGAKGLQLIGQDDGTSLIGTMGSSGEHLLFRTASNERMRLLVGGPHLLLGGTTSVNEITETSSSSGLVIGNTSMGNGGLAIINSTTGTGRIYFGDSVGGNAARNRGQINYYHNGDYMLFAVAGSERLRIASNGKIYVKGNGGDVSTDFSDAGTFFNLKHDTYGGRIGFGNGTASAGVTLMEQLGYWGSNKVAGWVMTAGGDATNKDDGEMSFYTRESGQAIMERLHIGSEGEVVAGYRVGTSSVRSNQPVAFHSTNITPHGNARRVSTGQRCNLFVGSNSGWSSGDGGVIAMGGSETGGAGVEATWAYVAGKRQSGNGWEYGGYFEVGTSPYSGTVMAKRMRLWANGQMEVYPNDDTFYSTSIGGAQRMVFKHNGGGAIEIKNNNGNMTFTSSSDYRLKKDEVAISNALSTVKALKPYQFTWKTDGKLGQGFFAHEAQAVLPDIGVVSGTKDEVHTNDETENGGQYKKDDPIYQGIDYSKLVPLLTAALQEETAKREALEARVAALEGS